MTQAENLDILFWQLNNRHGQVQLYCQRTRGN